MSLEQTLARCSFCGRPASEVQRLIAGPGAVYICVACLHLCNEILQEPAFSEKALELASRPPVIPPLKITQGTREGTAKRSLQPSRRFALSEEQKQHETTLLLRQLDLFPNHFELHYLWLRPPLSKGFAFVPRLIFHLEDNQGNRWAGERGGSLQERSELSPSQESLVYQGVARFQPELSSQSKQLTIRASDPLAAFEREALALWHFEIKLEEQQRNAQSS